MNEFVNELIINEEKYENGFFPKVPKFRKQGSAFILTDGDEDDILVDEHTTPKEIRKGRYTRLAEISVAKHIKEVRFHSPSNESAFSFDVYVRATIQVINPLVFYNNRNLDVDAYFSNLFAQDVKKITIKYSILDYGKMDEEFTKILFLYNVDEVTGLSYSISAVDAKPEKQAQEYVQKSGEMKIKNDIKKKARELSGNFTVNYEEAIMTEVAEGKLSETEAIQKIKEYKDADLMTQYQHMIEFRDKGLITDKDASDFIKGAMAKDDLHMLTGQSNANLTGQKRVTLGMFYEEDEQK